MKVKVDFRQCWLNILYPANDFFGVKIFLNGEFFCSKVVFLEDVILKAVNPFFFVRTFFFFWDRLVECYCDQKKTTSKRVDKNILFDKTVTSSQLSVLASILIQHFLLQHYNQGSAGLLIWMVSYKYELAKSSWSRGTGSCLRQFGDDILNLMSAVSMNSTMARYL